MIWHTVAIGVKGCCRIEWERIGSNRATAVGRNFRSVADAITIGVSVCRIGSSVSGVVVDARVSFHIIEQTIAVHVGIKRITDAIAIQVVWHVSGVEWVAEAFQFTCVKEAVVVVIVISNQSAFAIRIVVRVGVTIGVDWEQWVKR